ncbi:cation channel family protein [Tritrichomonas foetus]|uniref:Cation channel family protein n=1 Tax=Tritrichomonas foetus TaxID=1144522 RepID=A0A1J4KXT0_9EUKA|nr:cation channel family protein [Tritrichomonas foetus]|eukprot:OHT14500.1 cation channel family protein [Tritrichomonas foetus]
MNDEDEQSIELSLISDKSNPNNLYSSFMKSTMRQKFMFTHLSKYRRIWEYFIELLCFVAFFEYTFFVIFYKYFNTANYIPFIIFDLLCMLDLFVNLRTIISQRGKIIADPKRILRVNGIHSVVCQFFGSIPLSWIGISIQNQIVYGILGAFKVFRLQRANQAYQTTRKNLAYPTKFSTLYGIVLLWFIIVHFFACLFYLCAVKEGIPNSWIAFLEWDKLSPPKQYVVSFYFVMTTVTCIGTGDVSGLTSNERILVIFIQLIGVLIKAVVFGLMVRFLYDPLGSGFKKDFKVLKDFMDFKHLPSSLRMEILHYFQDKFTANHGTGDPKEVMKFIPETVKNHLKRDMTRVCLSQISMLHIAKEKLTNGFVNSMKPITFVPGDVIFNEGDVVPALYLFKRGIVQLIDNRSNVFATNNCDKGLVFGELELLIDSPREMKVVAMTYVDGWVLTRNDLKINMKYQMEIRKELLRVAREVFPRYVKEIEMNFPAITKKTRKRSALQPIPDDIYDDDDDVINAEQNQTNE